MCHDSMQLLKRLLAQGIRWSLILSHHFNTELGSFQYTVMPFGITVAGNIFQQKLDQCFSHLKNAIVIADDIMVVGKNHKEHYLALTALLETARKCNVWLNYIKLQYDKTYVDFFRETYMIDGHKPAQTKVSAITTMPELSCKTEVQLFMGMNKPLSKFSARLSKLSKLIRELSKEIVPFNWGPEHQEAFNAMQKETVEALILAYYDPKKEMVLQTDASIKGLGACLMQQSKPVYFASKSLIKTQKGYVVIELESLVVVWAMEKFHHFIYSTHFILETDQKPLEAILSKSLNQATPWLERILIQMLLYHFTVCHIQGPTNQLADCLSTLGTQNANIKVPKLHIYQITNQLKARCDTLNQLHIATQEYDEMILLKYTITNRWPNFIKEVPPEIQAYWTFCKELTIEDGLVLKGTEIVIPKNKHKQILTMVHEGHLGLGKCKLWCKDTVYWLGINGQLEKLVLNCELCLKYSKAKDKQPANMSLGQEVPIYPWMKVTTDIFHFENDSYLLIIDYTNRFPVVHKLISTTVQQVASQMKLIFSEYGWPETIVSDNGPCYSAETFTKLMIDYSVNHITSSPHYPQFNGLAEKYVQIVKKKEEGTDLYKSLMIYRNTPFSNKLQLPMQILQSRTTRPQLSMSNAARAQQGLGSEQLRVNSRNEQLPTHVYHIGQSVMCLNPVNRKWYPAIFTSLCQEPRSYKIRADDGITYRKIQNHLKLYLWNEEKWTIVVQEH